MKVHEVFCTLLTADWSVFGFVLQIHHGQKIKSTSFSWYKNTFGNTLLYKTDMTPS